MSSVTVVQKNFNGGELSPLMGARTDQTRYVNGCARLRNMVVYPHGPATRRPGFQFLGSCESDEGETRLLPFMFNAEQSCVLELGNQYMRVWMKDGLVLNSDGTPYKVVTPWKGEQLAELSYCQSADVLFVASSEYRPQKICRYGNTDWRIENVPIGTDVSTPENLSASIEGDEERTYSYIVTAIDEVTLQESLPSTPVVVEAAKTLSVSAPVTITWTPVEGEVAYAVYKCWNESGKYGFVGKATEGKWVDRGMTPDFSDGFPVARNPLDGEENYPRVVQFFQQRLCFAGSKKQPQTVWASCSGNYNNFNVSDPLRDDDSVVATIAAERVNEIKWMVPARQLLIGTAGGEWSMGGVGNNPLSPSSLEFQRQSVNGATSVAPIVVGECVLFLQRGGKVIREMHFSLEKDGYVATDLSILSEHMLNESPVVSWAYQQNPYSIIWCVLADGSLVAFTYERDHAVIGWHRHSSDGDFESVCTISGEKGDELWCTVRRSVNGKICKYMERLAPFLYTQAPEKQFFVDSGISYSGVPQKRFNGLGHLEGKEVQILADGAVQPPQVVKNGSIELGIPASCVHVGLPFVSELVPMEPEVILQNGSARGRTRRINRLCVQLHNSLGVKVGANERSLQEVLFRKSSESFDSVQPLFSGDKIVEFGGGYTSETSVLMRQDKPLPLTVLSYSMQVEIGDR